MDAEITKSHGAEKPEMDAGRPENAKPQAQAPVNTGEGNPPPEVKENPTAAQGTEDHNKDGPPFQIYDVAEKERDGNAPPPPPQVSEVSKSEIVEERAITEGGSSSSSSSSSSGEKDREPPAPSSNEDLKESPSDLKESERKALVELRSMVEHAILKNTLFKPPKKEESDKEESKDDEQNKSSDEQKSKSETSSEEETNTADVDKEISLWGVPLLPSKGDKRTDEVLLKFLRAREFKAGDAFEMLRNTLEWRRKNNMDSIMEEDFGNEYDSVSFMKGIGREGHAICYNVYGVFANDEMYNKTFGTVAGRERFLRWRLQLLEKEIRKLDFSPGGVSTLIQVNDLKNTPGPSRKDLRLAVKQAVEILQDNYPELVSKNIFINVPFWYYAFNPLLSAFLSQRAKSKFILSRPSSVTETLLKSIAAEQIPAKYGGLQRDNDPEFSTQHVATEVVIKAGATETIEIPMPEVGNTMIWDLTISGWDVNYTEEFVPTNEESYAVIVKRGRRITWQDEPIRNSFKNNEPGKVAITIENGIFKKKRTLYRYKIKSNAPAPAPASS